MKPDALYEIVKALDAGLEVRFSREHGSIHVVVKNPKTSFSIKRVLDANALSLTTIGPNQTIALELQECRERLTT